MTRNAYGAAPGRGEGVLAIAVFALCLLFNIWGVRVGWRSLNLPGHEFRQAQTALSAYYCKQDQDFSPDYATPVLGKPWSIPLEFPLYQWVVVVVSDSTGLGLIKSGRVVSLACFYLALPALYLLLGNRGIARGRRWLVLALVVTSPLYIFYARAFLIETMALMLSLWFWVAFERAVVDRSWRWLVLANLAGSAAGMVKVTTLFIYLLPVGWWALRRWWTGRRVAGGRHELPWMAAGLVIPLVATVAWENHADAVRMLNPLAHFLVSENLLAFTFGTWTTRLSPELWLAKWHTTTHSVTCLPALVAGMVAAGWLAKTRRKEILAATGLFVAPLMIFPVLYGLHDYYFVANGVLLLTALGLTMVGLAESTRLSWLPALVTLLLAGGQAFQYGKTYHGMQLGISRGGDGLTQSLRGLLPADAVIIVVGQQWNPMVPFYAQRRAMMIREEEENNPVRLDAAFAALAGEKIGALVLSNSVQHPVEFLRRTAALGIGNAPIYRWRDVAVYLRNDGRDESVRRIQQGGYDEVEWIPGVEPKPDRLAAAWFEVARLAPAQQGYFTGMNPMPVRFFSSFGPAIETGDGWQTFGAHPVTRLVFALPAGAHRLRTTVSFAPETYGTELPPDRMTDGVEVRLTALTPDGMGRVLYTRLVNPRDNPADRGPCPLDVPFQLDRAGEVELYFGPGPAGRDTYDWITMGRLDIE